MSSKNETSTEFVQADANQIERALEAALGLWRHNSNKDLVYGLCFHRVILHRVFLTELQ